MGTSIISRFHVGRSVLSAQFPADRGKVHIGSYCYIRANATILANVTLGDESLVGAAALVNRCFPPGSLVVGVPARLMRHLEIDKGIV